MAVKNISNRLSRTTIVGDKKPLTYVGTYSGRSDESLEIAAVVDLNNGTHRFEILCTHEAAKGLAQQIVTRLNLAPKDFNFSGS